MDLRTEIEELRKRLYRESNEHHKRYRETLTRDSRESTRGSVKGKIADELDQILESFSPENSTESAEP